MNNSEKSSLGRFCFKGTGRKFIRKLVQTFKVNCARKENGHFVPKLLSVLGCKWVCTVWKLISSRYESLASFESVPLIPVRHAVDQNNLSEGEASKLKYACKTNMQLKR
jgi:hypothetical protein